MGTVAACWRYPVKSFQGLSVDGFEIGPGGVEGDRRYGLVDVASGHLVSAKRTSAMLRASVDERGMRLPDGTTVAFDAPDASQQLSGWLGREVRLVTSSEIDQLSYEMTFDPPDDDAEYYEIPAPAGSLLDLAAIHLVTTATLAHCAHERPDLDWDVRRFRPNLVLDVDLPAFDEQAWAGTDISIGAATLRVQGPTVRCAMPLRAQPGLERQPALFAAMSELNTEFPNHLGLYCEVVQPGSVAVGDAVGA